ncbi:MAG: agmatinase [Candidatus Altiarchaeales archaeon]|nr:agmatinase [Candidatus Altiarchaeales archaeon]
MLHLNKNLVLESNCQLEEAEVALLGVPFDSTSSYRVGSRNAPLEIRRELFELEKEESFFEIPFCDLGNVDIVPGNTLETLRRVEETVDWIYRENPGVFVITLGGEHTITHPIVKSFSSNIKGLDVLNLDAHMDLKNDYLGEKWCHASVMRRISELNVGLSEIGVRSFLEEERKHAEKSKIAYCIKEKKKMEGILGKLEGKKVYLTLDFDVLSPEIASGVSNPEPNGLSLDELYFIFNTLIQKSIVVGMDVVEVNPLYDKTSTTIAAAKFVLDAVVKKG